jgi:hypothetical protein
MLCQKDMDAANRGACPNVPHIRRRRSRKPTLAGADGGAAVVASSFETAAAHGLKDEAD